MKKTTFIISKMDCPSEEQLIRMQLSNFKNIEELKFKISERYLDIFHNENSTDILNKLHQLKLDTKLINDEEINHFDKEVSSKNDKTLLLYVLAINFIFFIIEGVSGYISSSMGLMADSLDMLADAIVYGLAIIAIYKSQNFKVKVAKFSGYFQIILASLGFIETLKRFYYLDQFPNYYSMIIISIFALIANFLSFTLLQKSNQEEIHIKASMIFTSNDMIVNIGIILAGILVLTFNSMIPDLIIGTIVFVLVAKGAFSILSLK